MSCIDWLSLRSVETSGVLRDMQHWKTVITKQGKKRTVAWYPTLNDCHYEAREQAENWVISRIEWLPLRCTGTSGELGDNPHWMTVITKHGNKRIISRDTLHWMTAITQHRKKRRVAWYPALNDCHYEAREQAENWVISRIEWLPLRSTGTSRELRDIPHWMTAITKHGNKRRIRWYPALNACHYEARELAENFAWYPALNDCHYVARKQAENRVISRFEWLPIRSMGTSGELRDIIFEWLPLRSAGTSGESRDIPYWMTAITKYGSKRGIRWYPALNDCHYKAREKRGIAWDLKVFRL